MANSQKFFQRSSFSLKIQILIGFACALSTLAVKADERSQLALPAGIEALAPSGFKASETIKVHMPAAADQIYRLNLDEPQIIDMLKEFRCTDIIEKNFQRGNRRVSLQVYCFADPLGAYAAYAAVRHGASTVVVRGDGSSEDDQSISFWQNNYFIRLVTDAQDDEEAKELLRSLGDSLVSYIPGHADTPLAITNLPRWGKVAGSEHIVLGPVSGRKFLSLPLVGQLALDKAFNAVAADYQFSHPNAERMKLLVVDFGNRNLASSIFHQYVQALEESHKLNYAGTSYLVKLSDGQMLLYHQGPYLVAISGARRRVSAYMLAKQLDYYTGAAVR